MSSIVFRTGVVDENGQISINPPTRFISLPAEMQPNPSYEKRLFERKLRELGVLSRDGQHLVWISSTSNLLSSSSVRSLMRDRGVFGCSMAAYDALLRIYWRWRGRLRDQL